ncbi:MAG: hypothetical protein KF883_14670 [Thermomicrobiales bacterium]|nr:hypothetical protein [Thermomicrobiales bacterium]
MKTTFELPDELMREVKMRAIEEDRKLKDMVAELLRKGLCQPPAEQQIRHRVKLPLITGGHPAKPGEELTPERLSELLLEQEVNDLVR